MIWFFSFSYRVMVLELQRYLNNVDPFAATICFFILIVILWIIEYFIIHKVSIILLLLEAFYLTFLISLILLGRSPNTQSSNDALFITYIQAFSGSTWAVYDIVFNVLLFVPFGLLIKRYHFHVTLTLIIILVFPVLLEIIQLITSRGVFELSDIINNSLGGMLGYGIGKIISKLVLCYKEKQKSL